MLIRVYREQLRIIGKCELYVNGGWKKININNIKEIERNVLRMLN